MMTTSAKILRLARNHLREEYRLGTVVPKANADWRGPWDCAEFASWCVYQSTGTLFGCRPRGGDPDSVDAYSGYWGEDARKFRRVISVGQAAATPGAFLLRLPGSGNGHVAISAGGGKTVEAHSRKAGVIEALVANRRWDLGVLVPGIEVPTPPAPFPIQASGIVLRIKTPRMTGALVQRVQQALVQAGFAPGPVDAVYGGKTAAAVRAFQERNGLAVDGEVGRLTAGALDVDWY